MSAASPGKGRSRGPKRPLRAPPGRGKIRELFFGPLQEFPIPVIDFSKVEKKPRYDKIVAAVQEMLGLRAKIASYDAMYEPPPSSLREGGTLPAIKQTDVVSLLKAEETCTIATSDLLSHDPVPLASLLRSVGTVEEPITTETPFTHRLLLKGKAGESINVYGDPEMLVYLRGVLSPQKGATWAKI